MPGVGRLGQDLVGGTGVLVSPGAPTVLVNGSPISVVGDLVSAHGEPPHTSPTIIIGSSTVRAEGRPITVQQISIAYCGHSVATGSPNVQAT